MVDQKFQRTLLDLFSRKKYKDIILKVEEYSKRDNRPGGLSSLVGVCKMLNPNYTEEDVISALSDFEDAYKKLKKNLAGIEALGNYITACIKNSQKYLNVIDFLENAKLMFDEAEKNFPFNEKLYLSGIDLYKYLLNPKKVLQLSKKF
jgi:predicted metal-binding transcription factor (methanogenesis marker protein 9)